MTNDESAIALLHFSAVISVLGIAFVGLDRSHVERSNLKDGLDAAKPKAADIMLRLGLNGGFRIKLWGGGKWRPLTVFPANVICIIADAPMSLPIFFSLLHLIYRQIHIPFFKYFKNVNHLLIAGMLTFSACTIFAGTAWAVVWHEDDILTRQDDIIAKLLFLVLVVVGLWVLFTGWSARMLKQERLVDLCGRLEGLINKRFARQRAMATRAIAKAKKTLESLPAPSPPDSNTGAGI
jgi:hypothetical protein